MVFFTLEKIKSGKQVVILNNDNPLIKNKDLEILFQHFQNEIYYSNGYRWWKVSNSLSTFHVELLFVIDERRSYLTQL